MKRMMMAVGRIVYCSWYGAMVVFVAVNVVLFGLQLVNSGLGDVVPWPKGLHCVVMLIALANLVGAVFFSFLRRKFRRGLAQLVLCGIAIFGFVFMSFIVYCVPTRTAVAPDEAWVRSAICDPTAIAHDKLTFLGGISQREAINVFAVADVELDKGRFMPGSPWNMGNADNAINHYRRIVERARIEVVIPDDAQIMRCNGSTSYTISIVEANGRRYLFCERL